MAKIITPQEFFTEDLAFRGIESVEQRWTPPHMSFSYLERPRPNTGLFFLCADLTVSFCLPGQKPVVAKQGSITLLPKGMFYKAVTEGDAAADPRIHSYVVNFDPFNQNGKPLSLGAKPILLCENASPERLPLAELTAACHDLPVNPLRQKALFFKVLSGVFDTLEHENDAFYPIRHGVMLLRKEWRENHKIARYAAVCDLSESHFHTLFKNWAGITPVEYRNQLRLSHARTKLKGSAGSIEEIARQVGFEDPFYFSRLFKRETGKTPREYRHT